MRTIKFRGKDSNGNWLVGSYYEDVSWVCILPEGVFGLTDTWDFRVDEKTIGQFTGLLDKNGKEIYEGDFVKCDCFIYEVRYDNKHIASFYIRRSQDMFRHYFGEAMEADNCEVIGNIHDNPELLEKKL